MKFAMVLLTLMILAPKAEAFPEYPCPGGAQDAVWGPGCFGSCNFATYKVYHWIREPWANGKDIQRGWTSNGGWDYRCYDSTPTRPAEWAPYGGGSIWMWDEGWDGHPIHLIQYAIGNNTSIAPAMEYISTDGFHWTFVRRIPCSQPNPQYCTIP